MTVDGTVTGSAGTGLAILIGVTHDDGSDDVRYLRDKIANLRIFPGDDDDAEFERSALEVGGLRAGCGPEFTRVGPGIRPAWAETNEHNRIMAPAEALAAGADFLGIGRPITAAPDPAEAARRIVAEIAGS